MCDSSICEESSLALTAMDDAVGLFTGAALSGLSCVTGLSCVAGACVFFRLSNALNWLVIAFEYSSFSRTSSIKRAPSSLWRPVVDIELTTLTALLISCANAFINRYASPGSASGLNVVPSKIAGFFVSVGI